MGEVSDFLTYQRRAQRMKKLEQVLDRARDVFAASQGGKPADAVWMALAKLREAIVEADKTPPPHDTERGGA